ncbi:MAG: YkgJ family cysteine cluster protein [Comamonadaceae bacterium]|nr:YkgJ family cysteine cluster protein [Comamonadaceae bacterium]
MAQAVATFDGNVRLRAPDEPPVALPQGLRDLPPPARRRDHARGALLAAHFLARIAPPLADRGIDLVATLREAEAQTHRRSEAERSAEPACAARSRRQGVCVIYPVRPLACRGHASHDVRACVDAAAGRRGAVPFSQAHRTVRALVQNALRSPLRDAGLAWGVHEFNEALVAALDHPGAAAAWWAGIDPLAPARCADVPAAGAGRGLRRTGGPPPPAEADRSPGQSRSWLGRGTRAGRPLGVGRRCARASRAVPGPAAFGHPSR